MAGIVSKSYLFMANNSASVERKERTNERKQKNKKSNFVRVLEPTFIMVRCFEVARHTTFIRINQVIRVGVS